MIAVHFGAGNIGRGFIGLLLQQSGFEVVFSDVDADLVDRLNAADSYEVVEAGPGGTTTTVTGFRAIDSSADPDGLVAAIATADIVTTAVGPNVLKFIAPAIAAGILARDASRPPLSVMACENAIGATDLLREQVEQHGDPAAIAARARFANTAVDRIVPEQPGGTLDVTVEPYSEWAVESGPFGDALPDIEGAHFVPDLAPYIERKLYTVNTGHATTAYFGHLAGAATVAEALADRTVRTAVEFALEDTAEYLIAKHDFERGTQVRYVETTLDRFLNPALDDRVERVGREPIRKLGRHERFIGPAAAIAADGGHAAGLLGAVAAALQFDVPTDEEAVRLRELMLGDADLARDIMGLTPADALYEPAAKLVESVRSELRTAR